MDEKQSKLVMLHHEGLELVVDDEHCNLGSGDCFAVTGTDRYTTVAGGSNTVYVVKRLDVAKMKAAHEQKMLEAKEQKAAAKGK